MALTREFSESIVSNDTKMQLLKYIIVGSFNTLFCYALYSLMIWYRNGSLLSMSLASLLTVMLSYFLMGKMVFRTKLTSTNGLGFLVMQCFGYLCNMAILSLLERVGVQNYISGLLSLGIVAILTFFIGKFLVFNELIDEYMLNMKKYNWDKILKYISCVVFWFVIFFTLRALYYYNIDRYYTQAGDSAGFVDLIKVIAKTGTMVSAVFSSAYSIFPLLWSSSDVYCQSELLNKFVNTSFTEWHPYLIAYLFALPVKILGIGALEVSSFINALNIVGVFSVVWCYLRLNNINRLSAIVFITVLCIFPVWGGTVDGQFYFDRLYAFPCVALILFCIEKSKVNTFPVLIYGLFIVCISISERTALLTAVYLFIAWSFQFKMLFDRHNLIKLGLSIAGLMYVYLYMKLFQNSFYYNGINLTQAIENIKQSIFPEGNLFKPTMQWLVTLLPMLLLCLFRPKNILIVFALVAPNILVSVGGAEKIGFATHYHAGYIPFIIGYAAIGFVKADEVIGGYCKENIYLNYLCKSVFLIFLLFVTAICAIWTPNGIDTRTTENMISVYKSIIINDDNRKNIVLRGNILRGIAEAVPIDTAVSAPEFLMPALVSNNIGVIDYFPIGLGTREYLFVHYQNPNKDDVPGTPSFLKESDQLIVNQCIQQRIDGLYEPINKINLDGASYLVYRKK
jgi:hypothetical protein